MTRSQIQIVSFAMAGVVITFLFGRIGTEPQAAERFNSPTPQQALDPAVAPQDATDSRLSLASYRLPSLPLQDDQQSGADDTTDEEATPSQEVETTQNSADEKAEDEAANQDPTIPSNELRQRMQQEASVIAGTPQIERPKVALQAKILSGDGSASVVLSVDGETQFLRIEEASRRAPTPSELAPMNPFPQRVEIHLELVSVTEHEVVLVMQPIGERIVLH